MLAGRNHQNTDNSKYRRLKETVDTMMFDHNLLGKKIKVVNEIVLALQLTNVIALHARAESLNAKYDFILSRAVAPVSDIIHWTKGKIKEENTKMFFIS